MRESPRVQNTQGRSAHRVYRRGLHRRARGNPVRLSRPHLDSCADVDFSIGRPRRREYSQRIRACTYGAHARLDTLRPHFLEDTLPELGPRAEELLIGSGGRFVGVLEGAQFHRVDVVRDLAEPVVRGRGQPVDHRVFREGVVDGLVDRLRDRLPPVVEIDLDDIEIPEVR